ncbi:MAG: peptidylprolyl isomerase [Pyrinomonadaceae bacterium]
MKRRINILIALFTCILIAGAVIFGQVSVNSSFNSISRDEIEMLLADVAKTNPMAIKRLVEDPENLRRQINALKEMLAFASQAKREGLADEPQNKQELENIRIEVTAVIYDRELNKDKGPMPPFGFISDQQIATFWDDKTRDNEFEDFLNAKIMILRAGNPDMKDRDISKDEKAQARDIFAKTKIYENEFEQKAKAGELSQEFIDKIILQVKLQQASFLTRLYADKAAHKTIATDEEIAQFIAEHPEFDLSTKKATAQKVLDRAKAGENFAALANEFSDDPGNRSSKGRLRGGIYFNVPKGRMVSKFESAALALKPGQVASELVETDFGYHIIKLERKRITKSKLTYDVRHILISTGYKDPSDANARELPLEDYVQNKLEEEKQKLLVQRLVVENNITVAEDFSIPEITEKQINDFMDKARLEQTPKVKTKRAKKRRQVKND